MDPNANLKEQREISARILRDEDEYGHTASDDAVRLAELVIALDEWITKGGFLPQAWQGPTTYPVIQAWALAREGAVSSYEHDCPWCEFIGVVSHLRSDQSIVNKDVYVCPLRGHPTVVIRLAGRVVQEFAGDRLGRTWLPLPMRAVARERIRQLKGGPR